MRVSPIQDHASAPTAGSSGSTSEPHGIEQLTDLVGYGPIAIGLLLTIPLSLTAEHSALIAIWCALELALQGAAMTLVKKRWSGRMQLFYAGRMVLAAISLLLMPMWAGPSCPTWMWAMVSLSSQFVACNVKKALVCAGVVSGATIAGQLLAGATIVDLTVPAVVLLALVTGTALFTVPLRRLVLQDSADAVKLRNFQLAFEHAGEAICITDSNGKLLFVNPTWEEMTGIPQVDAVGYTPAELLRAPNADHAFFQSIADNLKQGKVWQGDIESETPQGRRLETHITVSPVLDDSGALTHVVEIRSDIKERNLMVAELRNAREAAEAANRAKSGFLANVSHEIRTPMNGVVGMASLLEESELSGMQREQVQTIRTSAEALLEIIQKVLDFASIEAGRMELFTTPVQLETLCQSVAAMIRVLPDAEGLDIKLDIDPSLPSWIEGDVTRLRQVLTNLMANGTKFTSSGSVTLRLRRRAEKRIELAVIDTGCGISEEALTSIFKPFFQVHEGGAKRGRGTGLGLAICNQIVQAMGSQIVVESELDRGTTFMFELDLVEARPLKEEQAPDALPVVSISGSNILVVEDDKVTQKLMPMLINKLGHHATVVGNGHEAIDALKDGHFALVFMDCQMPVMDGLEATRRIRASENGRSQLVLGLSADVQPEQVEASRAAGMNAIFAKPISLTQLREILATWLPRVDPRDRV